MTATEARLTDGRQFSLRNAGKTKSLMTTRASLVRVALEATQFSCCPLSVDGHWLRFKALECGES
jgi:hypothetical protein